MQLTADLCHRALAARDPRFDGLFYVAVRTTGIYCRPICPARTPRPDRCRYYALAAEAERDGFRACRRCRPELAPGAARVDAGARLVAAAAARIDAGFLDEHGVAGLARSLGVSERHLRRAMAAELGVTPTALAQSRRVALARALLESSDLPITQVAFASGFRSLRRFQASFRARHGCTPRSLRRARPARARADGESVGASAAGIELRLDYRPPLDVATLGAFLAGRAIGGVEQIDVAAGDGTGAGAAFVYRRAVRIGAARGWVEVRPDATRPAALRVHASESLGPVVAALVARLRALFDLDAWPAAIDATLAADPLLAPCVARHPGLRVPGAFDGFETAVRGVLGQQVTVRGGTTLAGRLVRAIGEPLATPFPAVTHAFPTPDRLAATPVAELAGLGMPAARARALVAIARAAAEGALVLDRHADPERTMAALRELPGIGEWTAQYVALRALGWPDALPAGDLGLRRALGVASARDVERLAERWRPWRAYAVLHLWTSLADAPLSPRARS